MRASRRNVQVALGGLWLLAGALQLQPYMFTSGFAHDTLASSAGGQPSWVAVPVTFFAAHIAGHPALFNAAFAAGQLALGAGLLVRRTVRPAIIASIGWALAVWYLGEGLGGLAAGHASLLTGAPGAVVLYAVLAAAVWPVGVDRDGGDPGRRRDPAGPARWLPYAWAVVWVGGAVLQLLPGQRGAADVAGSITAASQGSPRWLAAVDHDAATAVLHAGAAGVALLVVLQATIGVAALLPGPARRAATIGGAALAAVFWLVGQDLGQLYTGQATDPNTGPLLLLCAAAVAGCTRRRARGAVTAARRAALSPPPAAVLRPALVTAVPPRTLRHHGHPRSHPAGSRSRSPRAPTDSRRGSS
jgi:hypothetical protein